MRISKNIVVGELDIDTESGRIWLNSPNCILRIHGIDFKNISEKFSMIDINKESAHMIPGEMDTDYISQSIENMCNMIMTKISNLSREDGMFNI